MVINIVIVGAGCEHSSRLGESSKQVSAKSFRIRAQDEKSSEELEEEEKRVEAFESRLRATKKAGGKEEGRSTMASSSSSSGQRAEWKKGQLFPEGWEDMSVAEKMVELYLGERGFLYWSSQLAVGGVVTLLVAWVFFRFIGPSLGLYQLANDISTPNF